MRLVLDTNVLLSLFVYHDPRHIALRQAWQEGQHQLLMRQDCFDEFVDVIARSQFKLTTEQVNKAAKELKNEVIWLSSEPPSAAPQLPKCRDKDDQKFLELAAWGKAEVLLTYDKLLLKCRKRVPFTIGTPEQLAGNVVSPLNKTNSG